MEARRKFNKNSISVYPNSIKSDTSNISHRKFQAIRYLYYSGCVPNFSSIEWFSVHKPFSIANKKDVQIENWILCNIDPYVFIRI